MFTTHNAKLLHSSLNAFPVAMFAAERASPHFPFHILCVNRVHEDQSGLRNDDVAGLRPLDILPPNEGEQVESRYSLCVNRHRVITYREMLHIEDRPSQWKTTLQPVRMEGQIQRIIGTAVPVIPTPKVSVNAMRRRAQQLDEIDMTPSNDRGRPSFAAQLSVELGPKTLVSIIPTIPDCR